MDASTLKAMGFEESLVVRALSTTNNDAEVALELLLSGTVQGEVSTSEATSTANSSVTVHDTARARMNATSVTPPSSSMQSSKLTSLAISQYSFPSGASACTAIAITTMADLLAKLDGHTVSRNDSLINFVSTLHDEAKLSKYVIDGVAEYDKLMSFSPGAPAHLNADEFFATTESLWMSIKKVSMGENDVNANSILAPFQRNLSDPEAIESIFRSVRSSVNVDKCKYIGVVLTKPPETILVILPPPDRTRSIADGDTMYFLLFDSHSRRALGIEGAYFYTTTNEMELVERVKMCFPVADMHMDGCPTDGSLLAEMYNTIEVNVYQSFEDSGISGKNIENRVLSTMTSEDENH